MRRSSLPFFLSCVLLASAACSTGRTQAGFDTDPNADKDGTIGDDHPDGGPGSDPGGSDPGGSDPGGSDPGGPCSAGAYRCNGVSVEICNSSGTAWLYSSTCAVACSGAGLCTGACTPGATRCNGKSVETCAGTTWSTTQSCATTFCYSGQCALSGLDVTLPTNKDGEVVVDGTVIVRSGASLTSSSGDLTIRAKSIVVENGASIAVSPTGTGNGPPNQYGGGGGYGEAGGWGTAASGAAYAGTAFGSSTDGAVSKGGTGAKGYSTNGGSAGTGGGVLRLIASDAITIAGTVTAIGQNGAPAGAGSGGGGGGAGGGILVAADKVDITGSVSAAAGSGGGTGAGSWTGGNGGKGRVKILSGSMRSGAGTLTGIVTDGLLPPLKVTSTTHPDSSLIYNDDFAKMALSWDSSFPSRQGYYQAVTTAASFVPAPSNATFLAVENVAIPRSSLVAGQNYFHISSVNATSVVGTVESAFLVQINTTPATITSSSHPNSATWNANPDAFFQWSFPVADANVKGAFYVLDHFGDTVPTATSVFAPVSKKQQLMSGLAPGIWMFHVVAQDQQGYLTKQAGHYRVQIGPDPGMGGILGRVTDAGSANVSGATVTVNRGLYNQTTNATGNYNFGNVPAGTWEVRVTKAPFAPVTQVVVVAPSASTTQDFTVQ